METAQHRDRLAKNQPAEIPMFQISEVQEAPAFNGRRSFLTLRPSLAIPNPSIDFVMRNRHPVVEFPRNDFFIVPVFKNAIILTENGENLSQCQPNGLFQFSTLVVAPATLMGGHSGSASVFSM